MNLEVSKRVDMNGNEIVIKSRNKNKRNNSRTTKGLPPTIFVNSYIQSGLNFINIIHTAFTLVDPKSVKDTDDLTVFFTLSQKLYVEC